MVRFSIPEIHSPCHPNHLYTCKGIVNFNSYKQQLREQNYYTLCNVINKIFIIHSKFKFKLYFLFINKLCMYKME